MPVSYKPAKFLKSLPVVELCRDCVEGSQAVKEKSTKYLPMLDPSDKSIENKARYKQMKDLALFTNFTGRTIEALNGAIWRKDPSVVEVQTPVEYLIENCDGSGQELNQFAKDLSFDLYQSARFGVLIEYVDGMAQFKPYSHESIINVRRENGKLSLIVLEQNYIVEDDGFEQETETEHLVLRLIDGVYVQEIYRDDELVETFVPVDYNGSTFDFILFVFFGAKNNDETIDPPPIYPLAEVNLAHYRNSACVERSGWIMGEPMLIIAPGDSIPNDYYKENPIRFGVSSGVNVGTGGDAKILQADPNTLAQELQKEKVEQALLIGASLATNNQSNETATAAYMRHGAETSVLATIANNVSDGIVKCINYAELFMAERPVQDAEYQIGTEFFAMSPDAQLLTVMTGIVDRGVIPKQDLFDYIKKLGLVNPEQTWDDTVEKIQQQSPMV